MEDSDHSSMDLALNSNDIRQMFISRNNSKNSYHASRSQLIIDKLESLIEIE